MSTLTVEQATFPQSKSTAVNQIPKERIKWLWDDLIPLGEFSMLAGYEGTGKSLMAITIAADVTTGQLEGALAGEPGSVLLVATEDRYEHTIRPRLEAAGADLDMVYRFDDALELSLPDHVDDLLIEIVRLDAKLVILDPTTSRIAPYLDGHKDAHVRRALEPLAKIAHDQNMAVLGLIHINKSGKTDLRDVMMASRAFSGVAREVLWCVEYNDAYVFGNGKSNLTEANAEAQKYEIETIDIDGPDLPITTARINWLGSAGVSVQEAFREGQSEDGEDPEEKLAAKDWLIHYLRSHGGSALVSDISKAGYRDGYKDRTLRYHRKKLGITVHREDFGGPVRWKLPPNLATGH